MTYFTNFPKTYYELSPATYKKPAEYVVLTDITRNVRFKREVLNNITVYDEYIMSDDETIEHLSERLYGSPYYHWVIMLLNDRYDYINDLPKSSRALVSSIDTKYNIKDDNGDIYIESNYGMTTSSLPLDIHDTIGISTDFSIDQARLIDTAHGNTPFYRSISSITYYDTNLQTDIKRFIYTDDALTTQYVVPIKETYVNTKYHKIDWGVIPSYTPVSIFDYETTKNEEKRQLKIISSTMLQLVLRNFKELM